MTKSNFKSLPLENVQIMSRNNDKKFNNLSIPLDETRPKKIDIKDDLFSAVLEKFDDIKIGDYVRVIGKDHYKGHLGLIEGTYTTKMNDIIYKIQLQTDGETIDRKRSNIKKYKI